MKSWQIWYDKLACFIFKIIFRSLSSVSGCPSDVVTWSTWRYDNSLSGEHMYVMYKNFAIRINTATQEEMNDFTLAEPNVLDD